MTAQSADGDPAAEFGAGAAAGLGDFAIVPGDPAGLPGGPGTVPGDGGAEAPPGDSTVKAGGKAASAAGILVTLRESPPAVKALLAGIFINQMGQFIQIFLVLFMTTRGFTVVQAGVALSAYGAGQVLGLVVGGALSDTLGVRRATMVSMGGTAVLLITVLYLHNYPALLIVLALVGLAARVYRPANATMLSELTPPHRRVMIFAMQRFALNLGTTAAPLIGVALASVSWSLLFWGQAVAELAYAVIALAVLPRGRLPAAADAEESEPEEPTGQRAKSGYLAVLADRRYLLFLLALLVNSAVYVQYVSVLPVAMKAAGLSTAWYGGVIALNSVIVIACELLMTKLTQRWPYRWIVTVGFTLLGGGLAIYALPFVPAVFVIGTLVWSLAEIVAGPTMFAYPAMTGPARLRGRYIGAAGAVFGLGVAIGPALGVAVWDVAGRWIWPGCAAVCVIGLAAGLLGMRSSKPGQATA
jgi:MFS family permease